LVVELKSLLDEKFLQSAKILLVSNNSGTAMRGCIA